jgi:hypothetical protein
MKMKYMIIAVTIIYMYCHEENDHTLVGTHD